jgi:hypothetical protein
MPRLDVYGEKWEGLRLKAAELVDGGERNLSRVLRQVEADWRSADASPMEAPVFGEVVKLPRAALVAGRRDLIARVIAAQARPETAFVAELGAGWGQNLLDLWLVGGPRVPYFSLEPTPEGRACAEYLAALDPDLDLTAKEFDFERPVYDLHAGDAHALVCTIHSVEQITELPREAITGLFDLGRSVTGVHFEPIGWQVEDRPELAATRKHSEKKDYNRNLWPLLRELEAEGELRIETVEPDLIGIKPRNASTLIVWQRN